MQPSPAGSLPRIPGIDSSDLLERIGEDLDLFWDLLTTFSTEYRHIPSELAAALDRDPARATQLAHSLKGVLGNLGASKAFDICIALDESIGERRADIHPRLLAALEREIAKLCDAIERAFECRSARPIADAPNLESDWLAARCRALQIALAGHLVHDCRAITNEIAAAALPPAERVFFSSLHALVRSYRLKEAQDLLEGHLDV